MLFILESSEFSGFPASNIHTLLVSITMDMQTANPPINASYSDIHQNIGLTSVDGRSLLESTMNFYYVIHSVSRKKTLYPLNDLN